MNHIKLRTLCVVSIALVSLLIGAPFSVHSSSPSVAQPTASASRADRITRHGAAKPKSVSSRSFANASAVLQPALQTSTPRTNGKIAFASDRNNGNYEIYVTSATGGDATRLTTNVAEDFDPTWSPDGTKIAFVSDRSGTNLDIYVMNADGSDVKQITTDTIDQYDPAWSPDGSKIAFAGAIGNTGELYVVGAAGGTATRLTTDGADDAFPAWSPDGQQITFSSNRDGLVDDNYEIYSIAAGGGTPKRLTIDPSDDAYPAWSPDGTKIAFVSDRNDQNYEIFLMNAADGSGVTRLTTNPKEDIAPAWSPDGTKIVFMVGDFNPVSQDIVNSDIYTMGRDGGGRTNISNNPADDVYPDWQAAVGVTPVPTPTPASVQFSAATYTVGEADGKATVNVTRTGDATSAVRVSYATKPDPAYVKCDVANGQASERCDYSTTVGVLRFAAGETTKTITIPVADDKFVEGSEAVTVLLSNPSGAALGTATATLTITDNDTAAPTPATNPFLDNAFFVRQQYLDFLNREPDSGGFNSWLSVLNGCGTNQGGLGSPVTCDRVHVSSGFYRSAEFTDRGYFVYRFYEAALGRLPKYVEFVPDMASLSGFATPAEQQQNISDFIAAFMGRAEFTTKYGAAIPATSAEQFVAQLEATAKVTLPASVPATQAGQPEQVNRAELVRRMGAGEKSAAQTLRTFMEQQVVYDRFFFRGFVAMQYFGYLRRDPDQAGYNDWVDVITNGRGQVQRGDYRHLIFGFVYAPEYRERFGAP
jgi:TolB protein